ncbi:MAG: hypothetical protein KC478_08345 [Bacteriovoracaceae bacterium]|nr:hypothetical protein [Bacteriovoracaceae bacterium]
MYITQRLLIVAIAMMALACSSTSKVHTDNSNTLKDMNQNERIYERIDHKR